MLQAIATGTPTETQTKSPRGSRSNLTGLLGALKLWKRRIIPEFFYFNTRNLRLKMGQWCTFPQRGRKSIEISITNAYLCPLPHL
jgi:hypothetical protein